MSTTIRVNNHIIMFSGNISCTVRIEQYPNSDIVKKFELTFDEPIKEKFVMIDGRKIYCHDDNNRLYICDIELCSILSESFGPRCSICGTFPQDDKDGCATCDNIDNLR